jgi:rhamnogalacturonyl hydrolase YesR
MTMHPTDINAALVNLVRRRNTGWWQTAAIGLTPALRPILALQDTRTLPSATDPHRPAVLLIAGLRGNPADTPRLLVALDRFVQSGYAGASGVALSAVVAANPDALAGGDWEASADQRVDLTNGYPPQDGFYFDETAPERRYLWRWITYQAPYLLVEVALTDDDGADAVWHANAATAGSPIASALAATPLVDGDSLVAALGRSADDAPGTIPALRLTTPWTGLTDALTTLWALTGRNAAVPPSAGRLALAARRARPPLELARLLASRFGHALDPVNYTQGVGISGRLRLAALDDTYADPAPDIARLVEPIVTDPETHLTGVGGAALTGVVWAARLADATGEDRYRRLFLNAAERFVPRESGEAPAPCDPDFRVEDMFMCGAMLGRAHRITGDARYVLILADFLVDGGDVQQDNGLFWHARSAPFYWSRGNGFAALGYAEALTYLPSDHPARPDLERRHRNHLAALIRVQQPWGTFGELVDVPGAWGELTSTCMVGYALARGLREGRLSADDDAGYAAGLSACWRALCERIDEAGGVVDGCISTGVMPDIRAYLNRTAVSGQDDRTGSMALWFACEMHQYLTGAER